MTASGRSLQEKYGSLFRQFQIKFFWWHNVDSLRQLAFCYLKVLLNSRSDVQGVLGIVCTSLYLAALVGKIPYTTNRKNVLQTILTINVFLIGLIGILSYTQEEICRTKGDDAKCLSESGLRGMLRIALLFGVVTILASLLRDYNSNHRRSIRGQVSASTGLKLSMFNFSQRQAP
ncbi:hypothetical protein CYMTET_24171 [Cymbomonas tetramitiformis]|uniref:Uncharacterized protein n=1 Tax=Cymbomonas tetramitiformis TaxID=36881 RepID=A0AAE0FWP5_9CHLO|nr:hypothetical protein CYMTET_24171 [Cymbomonas tetramitiformis]